ncbi:hypothetical protein DPEC_G00311950 [Dallia pectoralis]|uniref:Uncharacterized protein n=1 Tax=Dallia pectoralis TaxID=75939 RepID=A0ACC2FBQ6_DALPE|nr:hypothetical protein DPEC_G00311950 [Dallia pectoralis]
MMIVTDGCPGIPTIYLTQGDGPSQTCSLEAGSEGPGRGPGGPDGADGPWTRHAVCGEIGGGADDDGREHPGACCPEEPLESLRNDLEGAVFSSRDQGLLWARV